ncbi:hypothetical protein A2Z33_04660 [Candidatus Gottesmanbacteria bacterium RBG_16_52_11]|uniref:Glycosyltransferase RgtA/B/C/D-like domain-containing protein n=1 Tax=Candidatus Gottesmanbacteria bacterium RBG_16_52_11 TaxID=1798374 RepID=A0A1F5YU57_9BACT|nr:MAG: hypothetical protein A2Z33_04660 [Candidatus Gottesmanbacteria bacterium RBG_16_52_11]
MTKNTVRIICILVFLKGIVLIFTVPPWEAPDEPGHVSYVRYLTQTRRLPSSRIPVQPLSVADSFLTNRHLLQNPAATVPQELFDRSEESLSPELLNLASHPPLYYLYEIPFAAAGSFMTSYGYFLSLRTGTLLLYPLILVAAFGLAERLTGKQTAAVLTVVLLALHPMLTFMSSVVNNDVAVVLCFTVLMSLFVRFTRVRSDTKTVGATVFVAALAPLVKPQLAVLLPILAYLLLKRYPRYKALQYIILSAIPGIAWAMFAIWREGLAYFAYSVQPPLVPSPVWHYLPAFISTKQPVGILMSIWGFFGWLDVPMPDWTYLAWTTVLTVSILIFARYTGFRGSLPGSWKIILISAFLYGLTILGYDLQVFALSSKFVIHGRYLLPLAVPLSVWLAKVAADRQAQGHSWLTVLLLAVYGISQAMMFWSIYTAYYGKTGIPGLPFFRYTL